MSYAATHEIIRNVNNNLTCPQKMVLTVIASYANNQTFSCFPSVKTIAEKCRLNTRTVQRHIASLVNMDFLERVYRTGTSAITRLKLPSTPTPTTGYGSNDTTGYGSNDTVICLSNLSQPNTAQQQATAEPALPVLFVSEIPEQPQTEQPEPQAPAIPDLAQPSMSTLDATNEAVERSNAADPTYPTIHTPAPVVEADTDKADPAMEEWSKIDPMVLLSIMEIRKAKRKAPKPNPVEVRHWYSVAQDAGWTLPHIAYAMCLRGWSRIDDASWLTGMVRPQLQPGTGTPAAPAAPKVWQETPYTPASPDTVASWKQKIRAMKEKWASESLNAPPLPIRR